MTVLAEKTEKKALKVLAKTLRFFDELTMLKMTAEDDADVAFAKRLITGVIENGGYKSIYERRKGTVLIKIN